MAYSAASFICASDGSSAIAMPQTPIALATVPSRAIVFARIVVTFFCAVIFLSLSQSGQLQNLADIRHDRRSGRLGQTPCQGGGNTACLDIDPVGNRTQLADGPVHACNHILLAGVLH